MSEVNHRTSFACIKYVGFSLLFPFKKSTASSAMQRVLCLWVLTDIRLHHDPDSKGPSSSRVFCSSSSRLRDKMAIDRTDGSSVADDNAGLVGVVTRQSKNGKYQLGVFFPHGMQTCGRGFVGGGYCMGELLQSSRTETNRRLHAPRKRRSPHNNR